MISIGGFSLVTTPTCGLNNILDLFATNRPFLIKHLNFISGVSDHDIIKIVCKLIGTCVDCFEFVVVYCLV